MLISKGLPNLRVLRLMSFAYVGNELVLPFGGFLRVELLKLDWLHQFEQLKVKKGAMPCLEILQIN